MKRGECLDAYVLPNAEGSKMWIILPGKFELYMLGPAGYAAAEARGFFKTNQN